MSLVTRITLAATVLMLAASPLAAQSDILLQLRSGSPAGDRMRVDSAGGLVTITELGIGLHPATGPGYRMMWIPFHAAFRAGSTDDGGAGAYWDYSNTGFYSWAGGNRTIAKGLASFAMGEDLNVTGNYGTALGSDLTVSGQFGFAAGFNGSCTASYCHAVGYRPNATGIASIALGYFPTANGNYSTAIGYRASTNGFDGAVVIGAGNPSITSDSVRALAANEFLVRAPGGIRLRSNVGMGNGCNIGASGTNWVCTSSRRVKENFEPVDGEALLERIRGLPLNTWTLIDDPARTRHIGPFAEDFHAAFGVGDDPGAIGHQDIDGVNFAGVQALERRTRVQAEEIAALRAENAALRGDVEQVRRDNAALAERLRVIEAALARRP